ncbi:phosphoglycolate phosphatase 1B, chloroplastic isoform X4 [Prunus persica]|uniref:phosphoglycolate phosphatase 1B, chloroplastic isoform X3 n=1 Tax=Prunus persica TaxID=3760 RepID=UPI0009ABA231|nr:phosphoglycolate phosphatase 1B, chloroplastic isoform X3 [Prunus persica]XP_020409652.1 phosphoglycolate phosphatase 1B, chloroplastic isoform X4 [Prunus persica]
MVYVIGEEGILKELELAGYQYLGGPEDGGKKIDLKPGFLMEHDENVGFDRNFSYYKIQFGLKKRCHITATVHFIYIYIYVYIYIYMDCTCAQIQAYMQTLCYKVLNGSLLWWQVMFM